ncbi:unnamed protein product [Rhizophagus irregularis]|uniref:Uncharacterized protein n=1 Tax=Rhizophagus irregularis TaxID=588596 RepID=A0A915ZMU2_9GLOM|nr:unnamed protein product [Rhizophagus irregularis]
MLRKSTLIFTREDDADNINFQENDFIVNLKSFNENDLSQILHHKSHHKFYHKVHRKFRWKDLVKSLRRENSQVPIFFLITNQHKKSGSSVNKLLWNLNHWYQISKVGIGTSMNYNIIQHTIAVCFNDGTDKRDFDGAIKNP